jgi:hypothetical protein
MLKNITYHRINRLVYIFKSIYFYYYRIRGIFADNHFLFIPQYWVYDKIQINFLSQLISGFYIGLSPLQITFLPLLSAFRRLVNPFPIARNPESRRFSLLSAGTLSSHAPQPPETKS